MIRYMLQLMKTNYVPVVTRLQFCFLFLFLIHLRRGQNLMNSSPVSGVPCTVLCPSAY